MACVCVLCTWAWLGGGLLGSVYSSCKLVSLIVTRGANLFKFWLTGKVVVVVFVVVGVAVAVVVGVAVVVAVAAAEVDSAASA